MIDGSGVDRPSALAVLCVLCVVLTGWPPVARAASLPPTATPLADHDDLPSSRTEIMQAMHDLQQKYGADAVLMEGHLLSQAIRNGSILEATVSVPGFEDRNGKRYLGFRLDTGIVYNDREVSPAARHVHAWTAIVEATLRKFSALSLPADGVLIQLGYTHKPYADEEDLRAHLREGRGDAETIAFYLLLSDVTELLAKRISAQQLVERATVLVDGSTVRLVLDQPGQ